MHEKINSGDIKPFVTVVLPCYNEEAILENNIKTLISYLESKCEKYQWEILIINDGSKDKTGEIANMLASQRNDIRWFIIQRI